MSDLLTHELGESPGVPIEDVAEASRYVAAMTHGLERLKGGFPLDGNGRVGRLLITLLLCHDGTLREPLLYCSLYFKQHRQQYYSELNSVRETGDFERWIEFFATAIRMSAEQATLT